MTIYYICSDLSTHIDRHHTIPGMVTVYVCPDITTNVGYFLQLVQTANEGSHGWLVYVS